MIAQSYFLLDENGNKRSLNHQLNEMYTTLKQIPINLRISQNIMNDNIKDIILHIKEKSLNNIPTFINQYNELIKNNPDLNEKFGKILNSLENFRKEIENYIKKDKNLDKIKIYTSLSLNIADLFYETFKEELKQFQLKSNQ